MGSPLYRDYTHWSRGDYPGATRPGQDDIAIIRSQLPARPDDVGDSISTARHLSQPLVLGFEGEITPEGIRPHIDYFSFDVSQYSSLHLRVRSIGAKEGYDNATNLAMTGELSNQSGAAVASFHSGASTPLSPSTNELLVDDVAVQPGIYHFHVRHDSPDANPATGFTDYGNGGRYEIDLWLTPIQPPEITSPAVGSVLSDNRVELAWDANGTPVDAWRVMAGSTPGGSEWYDSGSVQAFLERKVALNLPIGGEPVHLSLGYLPDGGGAQDWQFVQREVRAASLREPRIATPDDRSALEDPEVAFRWRQNDFRNIAYRLLVGSSPGSDDLYAGGQTNATSRTVDLSAAQDGQTVFATLLYKDNATGATGWHETSGVYQAFGGPVVINPKGGAGAGELPDYVWTAVADANRYQIEVRHLDPALPTRRQRFSPSAARCTDVCGTNLRNFPVKDVAEVRVRARRPGLGWGAWSLALGFAP